MLRSLRKVRGIRARPRCWPWRQDLPAASNPLRGRFSRRPPNALRGPGRRPGPGAMARPGGPEAAWAWPGGGMGPGMAAGHAARADWRRGPWRRRHGEDVPAMSRRRNAPGACRCRQPGWLGRPGGPADGGPGGAGARRSDPPISIRPKGPSRHSWPHSKPRTSTGSTNPPRSALRSKRARPRTENSSRKSST